MAELDEISRQIEEELSGVGGKGRESLLREYQTVREVAGPLMLVDEVAGVKYNELVEIVLSNGELGGGQVLEIDGSRALVQLFEGSGGIDPKDSRVRFLGRSIELGVSPEMLGRVFDGMGRPKDGSPRSYRKNTSILAALPSILTCATTL